MWAESTQRRSGTTLTMFCAFFLSVWSDYSCSSVDFTLVILLWSVRPAVSESSHLRFGTSFKNFIKFKKKHNISSLFQKFEIAKFAYEPKSEEKTFCGWRWNFYADVKHKKIWAQESLRISRNQDSPSNGEVQPNAKAQVHVHDFNFRHCVIPRRYPCRFVRLESLVKNTVTFDQFKKKKRESDFPVRLRTLFTWHSQSSSTSSSSTSLPYSSRNRYPVHGPKNFWTT